MTTIPTTFRSRPMRYDVAPPATTVSDAPRFFVRTVGPRFHVVDDATGYTVAAFWTATEAHDALVALKARG